MGTTNTNKMTTNAKYPLLLLDFNGSWIFWTYFREVLKYEI